MQLPGQQGDDCGRERPGENPLQLHFVACASSVSLRRLNSRITARDIGSRLAERRYAVVMVDCPRTGVVRCQSQCDVVAVAGQQRVQVGGAALNVLLCRERILHAKADGGRGHQLHEAARAGPGDSRTNPASAFGVDDRGQQVGIHVMLSTGAGTASPSTLRRVGWRLMAGRMQAL